MIITQGADKNFISDFNTNDIEDLLSGNYNVPNMEKIIITSPKDGYINNMNCTEIGLVGVQLGAGRTKVTDKINYNSGIITKCKIGQKVNKDDLLFELYTDKSNAVSFIIILYMFYK